MGVSGELGPDRMLHDGLRAWYLLLSKPKTCNSNGLKAWYLLLSKPYTCNSNGLKAWYLLLSKPYNCNGIFYWQNMQFFDQKTRPNKFGMASFQDDLPEKGIELIQQFFFSSKSPHRGVKVGLNTTFCQKRYFFPGRGSVFYLQGAGGHFFWKFSPKIEKNSNFSEIPKVVVRHHGVSVLLNASFFLPNLTLLKWNQVPRECI